MQDRFKFRIWDKSIGGMFYKVCVGFIDDGLGTRDWVCADTTCGQINYTDNKLKDIVLMQCTGLKDNTKWENLSQEEKQDFYNQVRSEDGKTVKYKNIEDVEQLWNGKLIFEGDILKVNTGSRDTSGIGVVEYEQSGCSFVISGFLDNPSGYHPRKKGEFYKNLQEWLCTEIIGNTYENPELLEVQND